MYDKEIKCVDCGKDFLFTSGEQEYYAEKKFSEPKRCKHCRDLKKLQKAENEANFTPGNKKDWKHNRHTSDREMLG